MRICLPVCVPGIYHPGMPPCVLTLSYTTRVCLPVCYTSLIHPGMPPCGLYLPVVHPGYASLCVYLLLYTRVCLPVCESLRYTPWYASLCVRVFNTRVCLPVCIKLINVSLLLLPGPTAGCLSFTAIPVSLLADSAVMYGYQLYDRRGSYTGARAHLPTTRFTVGQIFSSQVGISPFFS